MSVEDLEGGSRSGTGATGSIAGATSQGVEGLLTARLAALRRFVDEVADEGAMRRRLSTRLADMLAQEASDVQSELWLVPEGATTLRRQDLETRLARLAAAQREESVALWRDLVGVAREHRTWLKEYLDLQQRTTLVLGSAQSFKRASP